MYLNKILLTIVRTFDLNRPRLVNFNLFWGDSTSPRQSTMPNYNWL